MSALEGASCAEGKHPKLVASTKRSYCCSIAQTLSSERRENSKDDVNRGSVSFPDSESSETNYFKSVQWSPDGTCLITNSADNVLRTFVVPTDLLEDHDEPLLLKPYTSIRSPEPVYAYTSYPHFGLSNTSTTLLLSSHRDHATRLTNVLDPNTSIAATYPLICPTTEAYLTPHSLVFLPSGTHFLAGTESLITLHDVTQPGSQPVTRLPTIPSRRHKIKGGGVGMRGIVSAMALQPSSASETESEDGMLAAGTWTRWVSLYDNQGSGGTVSQFSIAGAADVTTGIQGSGVSQLSWSACGRYLIAAERKSDGCLIYDVRVAGKLLAWCEGRQADTNQRIGIDVFGGSDSHCEIWAGGMDGFVRVWQDVGMVEGALKPSWEFKAHDSVVNDVKVHPTGSVVVTSSGCRKTLGADLNDDAESSEDTDSSDDDEDGTSASGSSTESTTSSTTPIVKSSTSARTSITGCSVDYSVDNSIKIWGLS